MNDYRYQLERYRGRGNRYISSQCGRIYIYSLDTLILIIIMSMTMREQVSVIVWISVDTITHPNNTLRITLGNEIILVHMFKHIGFLNT